MSFSPSNQPFKDDIELKSDLRSDTLDTRQEYDLKVSRFTQPSFETAKPVVLRRLACNDSINSNDIGCCATSE